MCDKITHYYSMIISSDHITHDNDGKLKKNRRHIHISVLFFLYVKYLKRSKEVFKHQKKNIDRKSEVD